WLKLANPNARCPDARSMPATKSSVWRSSEKCSSSESPMAAAMCGGDMSTSGSGRCAASALHSAKVAASIRAVPTREGRGSGSNTGGVGARLDSGNGGMGVSHLDVRRSVVANRRLFPDRTASDGYQSTDVRHPQVYVVPGRHGPVRGLRIDGMEAALRILVAAQDLAGH